MQFTAPLPFGTSRVPNPFLLFLPVFVEESPAKRIPNRVSRITSAGLVPDSLYDILLRRKVAGLMERVIGGSLIGFIRPRYVLAQRRQRPEREV